jgi:hypothetical protein
MSVKGRTGLTPINSGIVRPLTTKRLNGWQFMTYQHFPPNTVAAWVSRSVMNVHDVPRIACWDGRAAGVLRQIPERAEHSPIGPFAVAFALRSARRATAGGVRSNYATGHQPAATATALLLLLAERREENHLADRLLVGEQHR